MSVATDIIEKNKIKLPRVNNNAKENDIKKVATFAGQKK